MTLQAIVFLGIFIPAIIVTILVCAIAIQKEKTKG